MSPDHDEACRERVKRSIQRHFERADLQDEYEWLWARLAECESCRALYNQYASAERRLFSGDHDISPSAVARVEQKVLAGCHQEASRSRPMVSRLFWPLRLAALGIGGLVIGLAWPNGKPYPNELFIARGEEAHLSSVTNENAELQFRILGVELNEKRRPHVVELSHEQYVSRDLRLVFLMSSTISRTIHVWAEVKGQSQMIQSGIVTQGVNTRLGPAIDIPSAWLGQKVRLYATSKGKRLFPADGQIFAIWIEAKK